MEFCPACNWGSYGIKIRKMANLHNRISRKELKERLLRDETPRTTLSFYKYIYLADPEKFRNTLYENFSNLGVLGRIYVANEGINAQISVPTSNFNSFKTYIYGIDGFQGLRLNIAVEDDGKSFFVLDIKVRHKIVADGIDDPHFNMANRGKYVDAEQFNHLTRDPNTIVIDMRNHYEYEVGHFKNALEVPSDTFREQLPMAVEMLEENKEANIIMYCTGGIRCEKASAFMLHRGFKNVFHLEGGIINYCKEAKEKGLENKFIGKNFVFDERLGERISQDIIAFCHQCGKSADTHVNCANEGCHLLFIQCEDCATTFEGCCCKDCKEIIQLPKEDQKVLRKNRNNGQKIFNKARRK